MFFLFFFIYISLLYIGLVTIYLHTLYVTFHKYDDDVYFSSPISTCIVSFLSLYTCFFIYAIFIFVSHKILWWVLFKCFRKIGCENLPCHKLSSCKVFQKFMFGLDLFCIFNKWLWVSWFKTSLMIHFFVMVLSWIAKGRDC